MSPTPKFPAFTNFVESLSVLFPEYSVYEASDKKVVLRNDAGDSITAFVLSFSGRGVYAFDLATKNLLVDPNSGRRATLGRRNTYLVVFNGVPPQNMQTIAPQCRSCFFVGNTSTQAGAVHVTKYFVAFDSPLVKHGQVLALGHFDNEGVPHVGEEFEREFLNACSQVPANPRRQRRSTKSSGSDDDGSPSGKRQRLTSPKPPSVVSSADISANKESVSASSFQGSISSANTSRVADSESSTTGKKSPSTNVMASPDRQSPTRNAPPPIFLDHGANSDVENFFEIPAFWEKVGSLFYYPYDDFYDFSPEVGDASSSAHSSQLLPFFASQDNLSLVV